MAIGAKSGCTAIRVTTLNSRHMPRPRTADGGAQTRYDGDAHARPQLRMLVRRRLCAADALAPIERARAFTPKELYHPRHCLRALALMPQGLAKFAAGDMPHAASGDLVLRGGGTCKTAKNRRVGGADRDTNRHKRCCAGLRCCCESRWIVPRPTRRCVSCG